jgi:hypothetical protein
MKITEQKTISIITPELGNRMKKFVERISAINSGYPILTDWHPLIPEGWGQHPRVPFARARVYSGEATTFAYSHHQSVCKFRDDYVVSWSNGFTHEDYPGQEVHYAWSEDALNWSEPKVLVHTPVESRLVRNNAGLLAWQDKLYCYVCVANDFGRESVPPGMSSLDNQAMQLDVYETADLEHWTHHPGIHDSIYLFEAPRPTQEGKLMCAGFALTDPTQGLVLVWDKGRSPTDEPRVLQVPKSPDVKPEQGTWYQTEEGTIYLFWRDGTWSGTLGLSISQDGGETWSAPSRTDMQNTFSRAYAGRLTDGRYYIVGNNYNVLLDRRHLLIALSDDGLTFDRMYTLVEGPTSRRINGRHKEDGYHYPNCLADGDSLLVTYSVNKEDIEVGTVKIESLS